MGNLMLVGRIMGPSRDNMENYEDLDLVARNLKTTLCVRVKAFRFASSIMDLLQRKLGQGLRNTLDNIDQLKNKSMMLFSLSEDEVKPGAAHGSVWQEWSFT